MGLIEGLRGHRAGPADRQHEAGDGGKKGPGVHLSGSCFSPQTGIDRR